MLKHGIYQREKGGETVYEFFWMGEELNEVDFNERLRSQMRMLMKDVDMIQVGMDLKEAIDGGEKADRELSRLEALEASVLKLPLCTTCRTLILVLGESP